MSKIKLDDIRKQLAEDNWTLVSDSYKNLDEVLTFMCSEGHTVYAPWKKIRTRRECPLCKGNVYTHHENKVVPKKKDTIRILALDQATKVTGWSVYDGRTLIKYGAFSTSLDGEAARNNSVKTWLINMINLWQPDYIAIEGIQYQDESGGKDDKKKLGVVVFQTLARLQGVLLDACFEAHIPVEVCPTNTWRAHCGVKGRTRSDKKKSMQMLAKEWFDVTLSDDEADSIGIGKYLADLKTKQTQVFQWE